MITNEMIDEAIGTGKNIPTPDEVKFVVAGVCGIPQDEIVGKRRFQAVVMARHIAMWICVCLRHLSLTDIGKSFGGRDHTTVIHAARTIDGYLSVALMPSATRDHHERTRAHHEREVLRNIKAAVDILKNRGYDMLDAADLINERMNRG